MQCDRCASETFTKAGRDRLGRQLWRCQACGRRLTARSASAFSGYRFPDEVIALAVRWYLRFRLSSADVGLDPFRRRGPLGAVGLSFGTSGSASALSHDEAPPDLS